MSPANILVLGGSGFLGSHLVPRLDSAGHRITVPTRNYERGRHLLVLPKTTLVKAEPGNDESLGRLVAGKDVVINLVGILHSRSGVATDPFGPDFRRVHVEFMERLVRACERHEVRRIVQVSALGVGDGDPATLPSSYLRSKAAAEQLLRKSPIDWVVFRPSVMFGPGDSFLSTLARLQRFLPFLALPCAESRFQPVYVCDVADAMVQAVRGPRTSRKVFELAGPEVYTLQELARLAGEFGGHPRPVFGLPMSLGHLQAMVMEKLPGRTMMSRDNLMSMKLDNVASAPFDPLFGITPSSIGTVAPSYLGPIDSPFNAERRTNH
jgi:NADH dehydrogenase